MLTDVLSGAKPWTIIHGDNRDLMRGFPPKIFQAAITSPPYFNARDYGLPPTVWGGRPDCDHDWEWYTRKAVDGGTGSPKRRIKGKENFQSIPDSQQAFCIKCRAWLGCLGLEPDPDLFVDHLVEVCEGVWHVLRDDGLFFLNLADTYANRRYATVAEGNLIGVPWKVTFALQRQGWILRSDVIWHKTNALPEPVKSRPSKAHEYIFQLAKGKGYFYDHLAVQEPATTRDKRHSAAMRNRRDVWAIPTKGIADLHYAPYPEAIVEPCLLAATSEKGACPHCGKPWKRITKRIDERDWHERRKQKEGKWGFGEVWGRNDGGGGFEGSELVTLGWQQDCKCPPHEPVPCVVCDPFNGSGTTGLVALRHGRRYVGLDLSNDFVAMATQRIIRENPLLNAA